MHTSRRGVLGLGVLGLGAIGAACACAAGPALADEPAGKFVCPPCGCDAHTEKGDQEFSAAGACPYCAMPLVPKPAPGAPKPPG